MNVKIVDDAYQLSGGDTSFFRDVDHCVGGIFASSYRGIFGSSRRVAMDCEGVSLSRAGTVELVSIVFDHLPGVVYLVDLSSQSPDTWLRRRRVQALRKLCECHTVAKIIHDCRMDSDALYHLYNIDLVNVHDTSCYHAVICSVEDANLNDTLAAYGLGSNTHRESSVYQTNPAFWATRPLTKQMMEWSSGDVSQLLALADIQQRAVSATTRLKEAAKNKSNLRATQILHMKLDQTLMCKKDVREFVGPRGCNIRQLQKESGAFVYRNQQSGNNVWLVYYPNNRALLKVKNAMGYEVDESGWSMTTRLGTAVAGVGLMAASGPAVIAGAGIVAVGKLFASD